MNHPMRWLIGSSAAALLYCGVIVAITADSGNQIPPLPIAIHNMILMALATAIIVSYLGLVAERARQHRVAASAAVLRQTDEAANVVAAQLLDIFTESRVAKPGIDPSVLEMGNAISRRLARGGPRRELLEADSWPPEGEAD